MARYEFCYGGSASDPRRATADAPGEYVPGILIFSASEASTMAGWQDTAALKTLSGEDTASEMTLPPQQYYTAANQQMFLRGAEDVRTPMMAHSLIWGFFSWAALI